MHQQRLTKQQLRRIQDLRTKDQAAIPGEPNTNAYQFGLVIAHFGKHLIVQTPTLQTIHCEKRQNLGHIVTGDNVMWGLIDLNNPNQGIVTALLPRRNLITRQANKQGKPLAANIDVMLIVIAPYPPLAQSTIERYCIMAQLNNIEPIIIINKADLINDSIHQPLNEWYAVYKQLNYKIFKISAHQPESLVPLIGEIQQKTSIVVGQSGVGKSSIIKNFITTDTIQIGEIAEKNQQGKHTTTVTTMYNLSCGGKLIDSPGVRQLSPGKINTADIYLGFPEIIRLAQECEFRNCSHSHEPKCAVKQAMVEQVIATFRLQNFHVIMEDMLKPWQ